MADSAEKPFVLTNWQAGEPIETTIPGTYDDEAQVWRDHNGEFLTILNMGKNTTWNSTVTSNGDTTGDPQDDG
jgi:hypothetical protein